MGLKDSDIRQFPQLNKWQYIFYLQKLCVHFEPLKTTKQDMLVLIHFIFSGLRTLMVHRSGHEQELDLLNLKANMMFQIRPLNRLESFSCSKGRQIFWKPLQKISSKGKQFFSLPCSDSHSCSCSCELTQLTRGKLSYRT